MQKEVADYVFNALRRIDGPWKSARELKQWWHSRHEMDMRAALVIVGVTPEHKQLYKAYMKRGNDLATGEHIKSLKDAAE